MPPPLLPPLLWAASLEAGSDDGLAPTPPMGWRDWNFYRGRITQAAVEGNMRAMAAQARPVWGRSGRTSLLQLGYNRAGLDDGWQRCGAGVGGSFHDAAGEPLWNATRFPRPAGMVAAGHALGLRVDWYMNNCICGEGGARLDPSQVARDTEGDVRMLAKAGFDGVKADGCGPGRDLPRLAALLNQTGRPVLIENCHYYKASSAGAMPSGAHPDRLNRIWPYWRDNITGGELVCPEHIFRASGDIGGSFGSWFGNLAQLEPYQDAQHPISRPGCWGHADMLMVGVPGPAATLEEWRSHYAAWAINSSPLILSFDLTNASVLDRVWEIVANPEVIAVNQAWQGHPGRRLAVSSGPIALWTKPQRPGVTALLAVSMAPLGAPNTTTSVPLHALDGQPCAQGCAVRDLWTHRQLGECKKGQELWHLPSLAPHHSKLVTFSAL